MTAHLRIAVAATAVLMSLGLSAGRAAAHGAPQEPVSRAMACGAEGGRSAGSTACTAARAASGSTLRNAWDNMRIAGVQGRDRKFVPDRKLCSAGLPGYEGLDLVRADWPSTRLTPGAPLTFRYRTTIPHEGTFELYVTNDGYDPSRPLSWSDLESRPFLTATDPVLRGGAYRIDGTLPAGKSGPNVIYTIWRNTSSPDTYYSCSDVDFGQAADDAAEPTTAAPATKTPTTAPPATTPAPATTTPATTTPVGTAPATTAPATAPGGSGAAAPRPEPIATAATNRALPFIVGGTVTLLTAAGLTVLVARLRR